TRLHIPINGTFELTPLCNMDCRMCFIRLNRQEMDPVGSIVTTQHWLELAKDAKKAGTMFILLTGGEPLLHPDFKTIYQGLRKLGMILTINTNGTLIDREFACMLGQDKPRRVNITLYGASNESYNRICHNPNGFDQVMNGIKLLMEQKVDIKLNGTLTPDNANETESLIQIAEDLGLYLKIDTYLYPAHRERIHPFDESRRLNAWEAANRNLQIKRRQLPAEEYAAYRKYMLDMEEKGASSLSRPDACRNMDCRAGKSAFWITWHGKMTPCVFMDTPSCDVFQSGFEKSWEELLEKTARIRLPKECGTCPMRHCCQICAASACLETDHYHKKPNYMCEYTHTLLEIMRKEE
ncbi:MAG: radical SAM protein, partial [Lachnospiraceae bacterium]|nr:radical SAM protein [Lachnospiraceae bacterium]